MSAAVPGLQEDMMAFTAEQSPKIWESLDFVNVMTYDLMKRRHKTLRHHTDLNGSLTSIDRYIALGLAPSKINLGIALYAKWFAVDPAANCNATLPIGCKARVLENEAGQDTGLSGAVTFESVNHQGVAVDPSCGANMGVAGLRCPDDNCCSQSVSWQVRSIVFGEKLLIFLSESSDSSCVL